MTADDTSKRGWHFAWVFADELGQIRQRREWLEKPPSPPGQPGTTGDDDRRVRLAVRLPAELGTGPGESAAKRLLAFFDGPSAKPAAAVADVERTLAAYTRPTETSLAELKAAVTKLSGAVNGLATELAALRPTVAELSAPARPTNGTATTAVEFESAVDQAEKAAGEAIERANEAAGSFGEAEPHGVRAAVGRAVAKAKDAIAAVKGDAWDQAAAAAHLACEKVFRRAALDAGLVGLAFSGGGIRSATFNLGVLQALAELELLPAVDYLSTVSGGGYIGGWLAAWLKREGSLETVRRQLCPSRKDQAPGRVKGTGFARTVVDEEPEAVQHLRAYSSYLSPRLGLLSGDTWAVAAIYVRNLVLNLLILLPLFFAAVAAGRLLAGEFGGRLADWAVYPLVAVELGALIVAVWQVVRAIDRMSDDRASAGVDKPWKLRQTFLWFTVLPIAVAAVVNALVLTHPSLTRWLRSPGEAAWATCLGFPAVIFSVFAAIYSLRARDRGPVGPAPPARRPWPRFWIAATAVPAAMGLFALGWADAPPWLADSPYTWRWFLAAWTAGWVLLVQVAACLWPRPASGGSGGWLRRVVVWWFAAVVTGATLGASAAALSLAVDALPGDDPCQAAFKTLVAAAVAPPGMLLAYGLATVVWVGLLGRGAGEDVREWWASFGGWLGLIAAAWLAAFGITLFGPYLVAWAWDTSGVWSTAAGGGWVGTTITGVLAGRSPKTGTGRRANPLEWVAGAAPYVFLVGLLVVLSTALDVILTKRWPASPKEYVTRVFEPGIGGALLAAVAVCLVVSNVFARYVNVNTFSLRGLYGNRLVRCYLGASRPKDEKTERGRGAPINSGLPLRRPNEITGFDLCDDFDLTYLRIAESNRDAAPDRPGPTTVERPYPGPYLLVNTALNLVQGDELAWQERKAESFVLTADYCGSGSTGYQKTADYAAKTASLTLGDALSVSGAAVSPNMGYHSSPAVTALLTMFNARLGAWVGNPRKDSTWALGSPRVALRPMRNEAFGRTNAYSEYVYLSDGGHFDNLGLYELVRRRCRYVVVCDAGADGDLNCYDLADVIRKCRIDFGVRIEVDTAAVRRGPAGRSSAHCTVGTIRYDDVDAGALPGVLVYLKPTLTGDEPTDVLEYAARHPTFPHQSTADQFYTESQFESYRALGYHVAGAVFEDVLADRAGSARDTVGALLAAVQQRWQAPPPEMAARFLDAVAGYARLQGEFARAGSAPVGTVTWTVPRQGLTPWTGATLSTTRPQPADPDPIGNAIYAELGPAYRPEIHRVAQMLQVMENAWLAVHLDTFNRHPINRGWLTVFRRWADTPQFRRYWPLLRGEFSQDFVAYCRRELRLPDPELTPTVLTQPPAAGSPDAAAFDLLGREFEGEWGQKFAGYTPASWLATAGSNGSIRKVLVGRLKAADAAGPEVACGYAAAEQTTAGPWDVHVWLRPVFRNQGIGPKAIALIEKEFGAPALRVWLPTGDDQSAEESDREVLWLSIFGSLGYHRKDRPQRAAQPWLVLEKQ